MSGAYQIASRPWSGGPARRKHRQEPLIGTARTVGTDRLDADMVGAGIPVLLDPPTYRRLVTPGDIGVDKPIGAAIGKLVGEADAAPIVGVIVELHIGRQRLAGGGARFRRVGFQQHPDFRAEELAGAEDPARFGGVLR